MSTTPAPDLASALYVGSVVHQRLRPARHRLAYRVFSLLLDLEELPTLDRHLRWFSVDRFNLFGFSESDHGDGACGPVAGQALRAYVERRLGEAGMQARGAIRLLAMPRILGYAFNPLSVYFCHHEDGALGAILYEVNNTFGERHSYLIEVHPAMARDGAVVVQRCAKRLRVSPFLGADMSYAFRVAPPAGHAGPMSIGVVASDEAGAVLVARLDARRRRLDDAALARVFASHPLLTIKVIAAIHWEALRLWVKGVRLQPHAAAPAGSLTVVRCSDA